MKLPDRVRGVFSGTSGLIFIPALAFGRYGMCHTSSFDSDCEAYFPHKARPAGVVAVGTLVGGAGAITDSWESSASVTRCGGSFPSSLSSLTCGEDQTELLPSASLSDFEVWRLHISAPGVSPGLGGAALITFQTDAFRVGVFRIVMFEISLSALGTTSSFRYPYFSEQVKFHSG
ncbi:hypothetical protein Plhal304r1_c004g0014491 [Plasmopara halstedii]